MEPAVLQRVHDKGEIEDTLTFAAEKGYDHKELTGVIKSLQTDFFVDASLLSKSFYALTNEGQEAIEKGSPEFRLFGCVPEEGIKIPDLTKIIGKDAYKVGFSQCMKNKWVRNDKASGMVFKVASSIEDTTAALLKKLKDSSGDMSLATEEEAKILKRRKLIEQKKTTSWKVVKGPNFALQRVKAAADLTKEMLDSGEWKSATFKEYNFNALGEDTAGGYLHPLLKVRGEFRKILMGMGFQEMPTARWVESSFWNFDALFQPQSHPARDAHDTFFLKGDAAKTLRVPEDYYTKVQNMHEKGNCAEMGLQGSIGYGAGSFKREEAFKNILRTHTTAVSSRMLYELAHQKGGFTPKKYFSIDRVFRNETMDATHLCEFHQVEGLVADYDLSLGNLIGVINTFFNQIGITQIRFKPAFNPYTEPSMEIFAFHPGLGKWTEVGNSGIFRPEMLLPMGLPPNVRVIAWGLSVERPTMIKYKCSNIRELFGHKIDLQATKTAPLCRLDR